MSVSSAVPFTLEVNAIIEGNYRRAHGHHRTTDDVQAKAGAAGSGGERLCGALEVATRRASRAARSIAGGSLSRRAGNRSHNSPGTRARYITENIVATPRA